MPGRLQTEEVSSTYSFPCLELIRSVEFSPFVESSELIAYGGDKRVAVSMCRFHEEDPDVADFHFEHVTDFYNGTSVQGIAWSPNSTMRQFPHSIQFCTIGDDRKLRLFVSDLRNNTLERVLDGHSSYINDCRFDPTTGAQLASVSDDNTCRLWDVETGAQKTCIPLGSAGVSVRWNPQEPNKLMVAEKKGIIRFYDLLSQRPVMSLSVLSPPLMSADWCQKNPLKVGGVALDDWHLWDTTRSSLPERSQQAHSDGVCSFRWSCIHENLFATNGRPGNQVSVYHTGHQKLPVSCNLQVGGGLSWHSRLPVIATGGDHVVRLWMVEL